MLAQPRAEGEDVVISYEPRTNGKPQAPHRRVLKTIRHTRDLPIHTAFGHECVDHGLATGAGIEVSALRLEDSPVNIREVDLRPPLFHLRRRQLPKLDPGFSKRLQ